MQVQLIDCTGAGHANPARHAANVLVFTKQTRLEMTPNLLAEIAAWSEERIMEELAYMANTIPSSWEFVDYTFLITEVSRAFTHQFVRTRTGSYAQQTMRVLNVKGWTYETGPSIAADPGLARQYHTAMDDIAEAYDQLVHDGATIEDARGVLPTNIHTNIVAKFDLRTIADMVRKRSSPRTQGEYRQVLDAMKAEVMRVHPWAHLFLDRNFDRAAAELDEMIQNVARRYMMSDEMKTRMLKLVDQMRMTA